MKENYVDKGRKKQKLETRQKILEGAKYFLSQGKDFTLEEVARQIGISRATVYRYFSNTEILSSEAGLDIQVMKPERLIETFKTDQIEIKLQKIQHYFNQLTIDNETAFRKYISVVLTSEEVRKKRGARRIKAIELALEETSIPREDKVKLANFLTVLMGIEPFIVTKDVCGLDNAQSSELLTWGLEIFLKGYFHH
ncbi:TetR/AcrR family transcriptional regulator [Mesonia sp. K7]|uniref:TetR/AcrR family transcriptional regulator n=1 Tax=Mesonia sp. K7 TaxID=2218606 RepID=UPI000DA81E36|nr:TetR/AcrR family transcriptional regulator [Mesonia sp. K7]PZD77875.1 TetR/AcrR family transcriptional regulator [Mesonia sp. K7]